MKNMISKIACFLLLPAGWLVAQTARPVSFQPVAANGYLIENLEDVNSPYLDYCALPFGDGVVFTSARGGKRVFVCDEDLVTGKYSDLYFAKSDAEGRFFYPEMLYGDINGKYHDGVASFTPEGNTMIFSRNNRNGQNKFGLIDLKIYSATRKNGDWVDVKELPFNSDDFATCHPSLSADGQLLFFASNRPGGYGGMDIYVSKKQGETWGSPVNLGPEVNTVGHEIFPFAAANGTLYFSSDGHPGIGGLDIFSAKMDGIVAGEPLRLPAPVNSLHDDFGFTADVAEKTGYLASNRPGGKGQDDIYRWRFNGVRPVTATLCVVEKNTGIRVADADLIIRPVAAGAADGQQIPESFSLPLTFSGSCGVQAAVIPGEMYVVEASKPGYLPTKITVAAGSMTAGPEYLVLLEKPVVKSFAGVVRNQKTDTPLPGTAVRVKNRCTGEIITLHTDTEGRFEFDYDCNCDYQVIAEKEGFGMREKLWRAAELDCNEALPVAALHLEPKELSPVLEVGAVIELENVYYDFDQFFIRSDAADDLEHVVGLMKKYPSLEIELGSHTDARGSDSYNLSLSQKRAEAAVNYIVSRGISRSRLSARGYGETQLVNRCANGVECTDEEHQQNRRTEIKVTKLEERGVRY